MKWDEKSSGFVPLSVAGVYDMVRMMAVDPMRVTIDIACEPHVTERLAHFNSGSFGRVFFGIGFAFACALLVLFG